MVIVLALGTVAVPAPASAATQIGETFTPTEYCSPDVTRIQTGSPGGQYSVPSPGVITSWSYQAPATDVPVGVKLKVARSAGGNDFTIVGEGGPQTPIPNSLNTYPAGIPVQAGDVIGVYLVPDVGFSIRFCARMAPGYSFHERGEDVPPGSTRTFAPDTGFQFDVSAMLEPDCDSDDLGDETQDPALPLGAACGKENRTLTLDANKNKVKKRKKVTLSGRLAPAARQGPCESGQTVELQRKRPSQTTFTTFASVQTDAQGSFSLKKKVKKTFEYRAQVVETATCTAALSNSEKVKVKKKKK